MANKIVQVTNNGVGTLGAISTLVQYGSGSSNWLSASVSGSQITVQFTNVSLAINTYQATLVVYAAGCPDSAFIPVTLKIMAARTPENPTNAVQGLRYKYFIGSWFPTPNFDTITPVASSGTASNFSLSAVPSASGDRFGVSYNGYIDIPVQGTYTFYLGADDMVRHRAPIALLVRLL